MSVNDLVDSLCAVVQAKSKFRPEWGWKVLAGFSTFSAAIVYRDECAGQSYSYEYRVVDVSNGEVI